MGRFSRLTQAKGKEVVIGDEKFTIKPLSGKYMGLFMDMDGSTDKKSKALYELVLISLQQTEPELTIEDIDELPLKIVMKVFEIIMEVNEFKE